MLREHGSNHERRALRVLTGRGCQQPREEVALFVCVMMGTGQGEVTQHRRRGLARRLVGAVRLEVREEALKGVALACDSLVARTEHRDGLVESGHGGNQGLRHGSTLLDQG